MISDILTGRPETDTGRLEKEIRVYDLLDSLGIPYDRVDHDAAMTMEACEAIDRIFAPASICKNLFLCNRQETTFYLLAIRGDKKFLTKELSGQLGVSRLSFANERFLEEFLDITPGSVSVMGLMNDRGNRVRLLVDEDLLTDDYFVCHPCINTSSIRLKTADVFGKFTEAVGHPYTKVRLGMIS